MSGIAYQEQPVTRPIVDEANDAFKWEKGCEVFQPVRKIGEDRVESPHAASHRRHSILAPAFPFAGGQCEPGLDMVRILGQNQTPNLLAQRDVKGAVPARRLLYGEPDEVEIMMLVFGLEPSQLCDSRVTPVRRDNDIGADFERLAAVSKPAHSNNATVFLDELRNFGAHPTLKRRERLSFAVKRGQEHRLRHPDGVGILRRYLLERKLADHFAVQADFA